MKDAFKYRSQKVDEELIVRAEADGHNKSIYPSWHNLHVCGMFCDGQDGMGSRCAWEKQAGPPPWYTSVDNTIRNLTMMDILGANGFTNIELVHEGSWGKVFKANPIGMKRTYAVKIAQDEASIKRLRLERSILTKIGDGEHITSIYFANRPETNVFYIVEEFVPKTLRQQMNDWKDKRNRGNDRNIPTFKEQLDIIKQVLKALEYAHAEGVVHQDLKPENILIDDKDRVRVCDFGFAQETNSDELVSSLEDTRAVAGSLHYLSPEQRSGMKVDSRTDLYNVGLIFYELLTSKQPTINMLMPTEVRRKERAGITNYHMTKPEIYPDWVDSFVSKALASDRNERFKSAKEMLETIERHLAPKPAPAPAPAPVKLSLMDRCKGAVRKVGKIIKKAAYVALMLPFWIVFAPLFFIYWAIGSNWITRNDHEFAAVLVFVGWFCGWYFAGVPYLLQKNVEYQIAQDKPGGTLVYYREMNGSGDPQGFYFIDGHYLPEIRSFYVETPEIGNAQAGSYAFFPKHALDANGALFYYTTPTGLTRIRLDLPKTHPDFRKVLVKSEVFNYFTTLAFVGAKDPGPKGPGLYAKLKNETWFITPEGSLEQTQPVVLENYVQRSLNGYYLDGNEVEFDSDFPGNFNVGPLASSNAGVWYDFTVAAFGRNQEVAVDGN